jgi:hypothetical protein
MMATLATSQDGGKQHWLINLPAIYSNFNPLSTLNLSDDDFIGSGLGLMGYSRRQFQNANLLEVDSRLEFFKINILRIVMFQNVLIDFKISKEI